MDPHGNTPAPGKWERALDNWAALIEARPRRLSATLLLAAAVGLLVFLLCLVGIFSRTPGTLSAFWPANAILLAVLVREPALVTGWMWVCAAIGYMSADVVTGSEVDHTVLLSAANVVGVAGGYYVFAWLGPNKLRLQSISSLGHLLVVVAAASFCSSIAGGFVSMVLFRITWLEAVGLWFPAEFVNYMTLAAMVLAAPSLRQVLRKRRLRGERRLAGLRRLIFLALLLAGCMALGWVIGGAGVMTFTMPALVAAALLTSVFVTTVFATVSTAWVLFLASIGHLGVPLVMPVPVSASTQMGLAMLAVGPIAVACVTAERRQVGEALRIAVTRDDLTGALRRGEFFRRAESILHGLRPGDVVSVMMLDLDNFKKLNDKLGHRAGDIALMEFAAQVKSKLTDKDLFARMGGEEFSILLSGVSFEEATARAEGIRADQQRDAERYPDVAMPTVSIGVFHAVGPFLVDELLARADRALYQAKQGSRNCVVTIANQQCSTEN